MVDRWEPCIDKGQAGMTECRDQDGNRIGDYVLYTDYAELEKENRRLREGLEKILAMNITLLINEIAKDALEGKQ